MEFFNPNANFNFMKYRKITVYISVFLVIASSIILWQRGLNLALDFTGGTVVEVEFDNAITQEGVSKLLSDASIQKPVVQGFSSTAYSIRLSPDAVEAATAHIPAAEDDSSLNAKNSAIADTVLSALTAGGNPAKIIRSEFVGPQVGKDLTTKGVWAIIVVLTLIVIYIAWRFEWRFALATILTEVHDVLIMLAIFAIFQWDFDLTVLAAILAIDGYSVNDTIVVFDRVRELFRTTSKLSPTEVINRAINSTMSRTIMTSLTTLLTVVMLYVFGGESLKGFALALIIGIIGGTFSTIFFSTPLLLLLGVSKQDLMPKIKDESDLDRRP